MYYYHLVFFLLFCLIFERVLSLFILAPSIFISIAEYIFHVYNNSTNFLMFWNNCHLNNYSNRLYIGITVSRSSALLINVSLIFDMHYLSGAWFLKVSFLFPILLSLSPSRVIVPFAIIYMHQFNHTNLILILMF